jgi:hypothetical protein
MPVHPDRELNACGKSVLIRQLPRSAFDCFRRRRRAGAGMPVSLPRPGAVITAYESGFIH